MEIAGDFWQSYHCVDVLFFCIDVVSVGMTSPDCILFDPYVLLIICPDAYLSDVPDSRLYIIDQSLYYELIPMHSMDDGCTGYPMDISSLSSTSLLGG